MLRNSLVNADAMRFLGGHTLAGMASRCGWGLMNRMAFGKYVAKPYGYRANAIAMPVTNSSIMVAWFHDSQGSLVADALGWGDLPATLPGTGDLTAAMTALKDLIATLQGTGSLSVGVGADGKMGCYIRIGFQPSADDIYYALLDTPLAIDGLSMRGALRVIMAALAGKVSGADVNAPVFRAVDDAKARITATTDAAGNRITVTVDGG